MVNVDRHFNMLATYYLYFNCSKFPKKAHELEINKKKSREAWETRAEKVILAHEERKTRGTRTT